MIHDIAGQGKRQRCYGALSFKQLCALARKNLLLQRRAPFQLILELIVPAGFIYLLGFIRSKYKPSTFEGDVPGYDTPVPTYGELETFAAHPNVYCFDNNPFFRCGCHNDAGYGSSYLDSSTVSRSGRVMWNSGHSHGPRSDACSAATGWRYYSSSAYSSGTTSLSTVENCILAKFESAFCDYYESFSADIDTDDDDYSGVSDDVSESVGSGSIVDLEPMSVENACEVDTFEFTDFNTTDYYDLLVEAAAILGTSVVFRDNVIPEEEIDNVCQALVFAVMPEDDGAGVEEAAAFLTHVQTTYPDTANHWQLLDSERDFVDIVTADGYQAAGADAAFSFGIVFSSGSPDWEYTIRTNSTKIGTDADYGTDNIPFTGTNTDKLCKEPPCTSNSWAAIYHQSAVLAIQQLVDNWIISQSVSSSSSLAEGFTPPVVRMAEFPHAAYESDGFWAQTSFAFAILVVISVMYPVSNVISSLVKEKELRIKEGLKMMGLTGFAHTASWIFHFVCLFFCTALLMVLVSSELFRYSDKVLIFFYLFIFFMATVAFCFFISAFFSRARTASTIGTLAFFVALFPYFAVDSDSATKNDRRAACLLPPTCLALGTISLTEFEDAGLGITSDTADSSDGGLSFNDVIGMLLVDIIIYSFLAWYASNVLPSEWGTARKPWFIFTKSYWFPGMANRDAMEKNAELLRHDESENLSTVEPVSDELRGQVQAGQCVAIRGLTKIYKSSIGGSKLAVDNLDLTMYSGQITALLGHNGAGKTTAIAMLTGMTPATSGSAFVAGRDVIADMSNIRNSLGVCPQHDILYPDLTVREHLRMYAVLKGVPDAGVAQAIQKTLVDVGLTEKKNERTKTLSGGQKRKLSVGIALIGGSKVVFLDEPTSGMDPHSRRFTWDLIRKNREGRVVVLTTHFMDEADLLGDRVAIMADGKLKCCGSSIFLKRHYGVGYNLTIVRGIGGSSEEPVAGGAIQSEEKMEEGQNGAVHTTTAEAKDDTVKPIKTLVRSHVNAAKLLSNVGAELSFQLPQEASSSFKEMLCEIDSRKAELSISSYGVSVTTLEEVFLKVASGTADNAHRDMADLNGQANAVRRASSQSSVVPADHTGEAAKQAPGVANGDSGGSHSKNRPGHRSKMSLFGSQALALWKKRMLSFRRDKKMWAFVVLMPVIFVSAGSLILLAFTLTNWPALTLTPESYNRGGAPLPYAAQCTIADGLCDPEGLMEFLTSPESARSVSLDIGDDADPGDAVFKLNTALLETSNSYDDTVYGALSFRQADTSTATFDYTIHSNYSALHSTPVYLNQVNSAILRLLSGDDTLGITTTIHPMPLTVAVEEQVDATESFFIVIFTIMAFSFVPAGWIMYIVREKDTKCKHQQVVSGVGLEAYWVSSYAWDFVSLLIPAGFTMIIYITAGVTPLLDNGATVAVVLLFILYGMSMIPYTYLGSFLFKSHTKAQNLWLFHNFVLGILGPFAVFFIANEGKRKLTLGFMRLLPHFSFSYALLLLAFTNSFEQEIGADDDDSEPVSSTFALKLDSTRQSLIYLAAESVGYFMLLLVVERISAGGSCASILFGKLSLGTGMRNLSPQHLGEGEALDEDVAREVQRVDQGEADGSVVKIDHLSKVYPSSRGAKVAVKSTSLAIPKGECFGLLGINGAGKSSILSILSGEIPATRGSAFLGGHDVSKEPEAIHRLVGYCPQFDALFDTLTGREHLRLYAAIKGIHPRTSVETAVDAMIDEMGIAKYADKLAGGYSGGNKRKLSVAIAMIGGPQIVFLDEPSTGMDPMARRLMWNFVMRVVTQNKECAMVLTTHSMEECEALCQRIGIMVGGRMRCLGSSQHLKTRFGKGFQLETRVEAIPSEEINAMLAIISPATSGQAALTDTVLGPALDAAECPEFASEISATGRGALIFHAIASSGTVAAREFASWLCLEKKCAKVISFLEESFCGARLREKQNAKMRFEIPQQEEMSLGAMFGFIEANAKLLGIGEYSLSQISLEQIFNGFAAQQLEEQGRAVGIV